MSGRSLLKMLADRRLGEGESGSSAEMRLRTKMRMREWSLE
jgi:hypothetical protein